ncbi:hypothetical protein TWF696_003282 [Orbilia brochopaga]|uniref:Uncharacterized protein n=1 Tax=Orbilia brochopaga TaxID=3140254 RepID=A0AAV9U275_9PEZI
MADEANVDVRVTETELMGLAAPLQPVIVPPQLPAPPAPLPPPQAITIRLFYPKFRWGPLTDSLGRPSAADMQDDEFPSRWNARFNEGGAISVPVPSTSPNPQGAGEEYSIPARAQFSKMWLYQETDLFYVVLGADNVTESVIRPRPHLTQPDYSYIHIRVTTGKLKELRVYFHVKRVYWTVLLFCPGLLLVCGVPVLIHWFVLKSKTGL